MKALAIILVFLVSIPTAWGEEDLPLMPKGPLVLTSDKPEMFSADYWISRLPEPDRLLKTPEELQRMNEDILLAIPERVDVFRMDLRRPGKPIREQIEFEYDTVRGRILFGVDDKPIPVGIFEDGIFPLLRLNKIPERIELRWGAAARAASVRALPTDVKMLEELGDYEFDQLQFTLIKLWTPVAILHESSDGKWYYVQAPYTRGWVKSKDVALFSSRDELKLFAQANNFLVVTGENTPLFTGLDFKEVHQRPSMGTILPQAGESAVAFVVWIPVRGGDGKVSLGRAYVDLKSDVSRGFLSYTQRNIIRQAFKLLGARYGWGGMYDGRDCSGFTHDVFLSMGVDMPRNSKEQAFVGTQINHFKPFSDPGGKMAALRSGTPGLTLLRMPLHQMLYLGEVDGQFYAIHSTWAERISMESDEKNRINQVVVSDLTLNGHSYLGSLFDRIISISELL